MSENPNELEPIVYSRDQHSVSRKNIDRDALKIMYRLMRHGYKAYLVGGGVRDLLLGYTPKDFDIGTDAKPRQIKTLFRNSRIIGRRFKLVHIYFRGGKIIEVATFRAQDTAVEDGEVKNGDDVQINENIYGSDATDAFRRDLTINGLFYDLNTFSVIDYVGGVEDLNKKVIRVIGDPDLRFAEDSVRLLRTVRHAARTDFDIEKTTLSSIIRNKELIKDASKVRLYEELKKDLLSGHSLKIFRLLATTGLLDYLMPDLAVNNAELLSDYCECSTCFSRADAMAKDGVELNSTPIIAAITLFVNGADFSLIDLPTRFQSKHDLEKHLQNSFMDLALPKKERERILKILFAWFELVQTPANKVKSSKWSSKPYVEDLLHLFELLCASEEDQDIIKILKRSVKQRKHNEKETRKRAITKKGRSSDKKKINRFM